MTTTNSPSICIIGCGWLGHPLAIEFISLGFEVFGSTTSSEKLMVLKSDGIHSFLFRLDETTSKIPVCDHYVINIPPSGSKDYLKGLQRLYDNLPPDARNVFFCSSTSVYSDIPDQICLEEDVPPGELDPSSNIQESNHGTRRSVLIQAEGIFARHPHATILRLSGLYGTNRHPVKYLAGRKNISKPMAVVNLVHLDDIIATTIKLIHHPPVYSIYNVTASEHPTRVEYYTKVAKQLNLTPPEFDSTDPTTGKIIGNKKLVELLGYEPSLKDS